MDNASLNKKVNSYIISKKKTKDKPIPESRLKTTVKYDFLKYIRVVLKWAVDNHPLLNRPLVELLLYLYPLGAFSRTQFYTFHKTISILCDKNLNYLIENGYIQIFRPKGIKNIHKLYSLTPKSKALCNNIHEYCAGLRPIPEQRPSKNKMLEKDKPRINKYYIDIVKRMNKDLL